MARHAEIKVASGEIIVYRQFDVADGIDLTRAEATLRAGTLPRLAFRRVGYRSIELPNPPATVELGTQSIELGAATLHCECSARIYDVGSLSIQVRIPIARGTPFEEVVALSPLIDDNISLEQLTRRLADELAHRLAPASERSHHWETREEYTVFFVREFTPPLNAEAALERLDIARLLLGEPSAAKLSEPEREDVLKRRLSYFEDDVAVIDWNSAFVLEPSGARDIPDLLEFATTQLLELRYYDALLDRELAQTYAQFDALGGRTALINLGRYTALSRRLLRLSVEISEITERIDNSLKIIGDFALARVYQAAVERFRIAHWQRSIDRKEAIILQIYNLLHNQITVSRNLIMEGAIVLLFVLDLVLLLAKAK